MLLRRPVVFQMVFVLVFDRFQDLWASWALFGGMVPLDLRFRGPREAKSFVRGPKIDPPGAPGRVFDLKCTSCGYVRRCTMLQHASPSTGCVSDGFCFGFRSVSGSTKPLLTNPHFGFLQFL